MWRNLLHIDLFIEEYLHLCYRKSNALQVILWLPRGCRVCSSRALQSFLEHDLQTTDLGLA